ncbi:hypothetical protein EUTSA_v10026698mg [Eutrema salsugineum]|uniref:Knottin scorpion toxin-like domain-containing protein n=1 Tax=Eutrema salsugineum TaxID=72664 RepID=V4MQ02_EUTSA|nr:hypothetical protein EUTSA_v10026698mg [Eutrema salsugineum]
MGSLRLSTVVVAAVFVCFSILILSPTEVEGSCDIPWGVCHFISETWGDKCNDKCKASGYDSGTCTPGGDVMTFIMTCMCCH